MAASSQNDKRQSPPPSVNEVARHGNSLKVDKAAVVLRGLKQLAAEKKLPEAWLREEVGVHDLNGGVGIPYYGDEGGEPLFVRERDTQKCVRQQKRFLQPKGVSLIPYGTWRLD